MKVVMSIKGLDRLLSKVSSVMREARVQPQQITDHYAEVLKDTIVRNASGRPGPRQVTGEYADSWEVFTDGPYRAGARTDAPQAERLEYGYVGVDAEGRHYNQAAYPHIWPAVDEVSPQYKKAMRGEVQSWLK